MAAKPVLLVTRKLPEAIEARAARDYDARLNPDDAMWADNGAEIARRAAEAKADGILGAAGDKLDASCIDALPDSVKIITTFSVGFDHVDLQAAKARGIAVTNTPDVLSFATAEAAFTLLLMAARRAGEGERMVRAGKWEGWAPTQLLGVTLEGKRLGILGMGRIGRELAAMTRGFRWRSTTATSSPCRPRWSRGPSTTRPTTPSSAPSTSCPCTSQAARPRASG
jgi:lactate dehydrogenase-like 2-hydroxyacid dehydrogenase